MKAERQSSGVVRTCFQCGRVGTRGFKHQPDFTVDFAEGSQTIKGWYTCANENACRKRWPNQEPVDE